MKISKDIKDVVTVYWHTCTIVTGLDKIIGPSKSEPIDDSFQPGASTVRNSA